MVEILEAVVADVVTSETKWPYSVPLWPVAVSMIVVLVYALS